MIAPRNNAEFVANMEKVLDVYKRPYDGKFPVVCFDEMPRQLIGETRIGRPLIPDHPEQIDYEYVRNGTVNVLLAFTPLQSWRMTEITATKKKLDWALFTEKIVDSFPNAEKIILVQDNLNTHTASSWYECFEPKRAKRLMDKVEFVYTPKHGSWLNMAEIELHSLSRQCLNRRIADIETMRAEVTSWTDERNKGDYRVNWQFTVENARIKLDHIYPKLEKVNQKSQI